MLSNYIAIASFFFLFGNLQAQTTVSGSFVHGGITRTYSFYVPASYTPGIAVPLVINLHGTGTDGDYQAANRDFRPIADTANFIVAHPDGTLLFGQRFWNYGNVFGSTVDDVGFLEALIDTIAAQYTINPLRIYSTGMSNGSFMSYCLACQSDRFAAIGGVTGSMSTNMYNTCIPSQPIPVIHIHGTTDGVNPYEGTSTMKAIDDVIDFWVNQNNCNTSPTVMLLPDINTTDDAIATRYLYNGGVSGNAVELFKVTGGGHTWPGSPVTGSSGNTCMDFDACIEIWRFFSQYDLNGILSVEDQTEIELEIWPNPTYGYLYIQSANYHVTEVTILDIHGRLVEKISDQNIEYIDLSHLQIGNYIVRISGDDFSLMKKIIIQSH